MKKAFAAFCSIFMPILSCFAFEMLEGQLADSKYYPGTVHTFQVSVPEGYNPENGAALFLGLDGVLCHAPARIDSLISTGDIPSMIGIYLQSGVVKDLNGKVLRYNRSNEFDAPDGRFARFLEAELLPEVQNLKTADGKPLNILKNPRNRLIFGLSSGAAAAFSAAFFRPDLFGKMYGGCGTFVPMRGADGLQSLVRKGETRDVKIYLQDGFSDSWNPLFGSWYEANRLMASALEFAGYECEFDWAEGGHSVARSSLIFPEVMKWLFRDGKGSKMTRNATLAPILASSGEWTEVCVDSLRCDSVGALNKVRRDVSAVYPDSTFVVRRVDGSNYLWQELLDRDGVGYAAQPFYWLHSPENRALRIGGMCFDADGMLWVLTEAGIQICDQNGRVRGILDIPVSIKRAVADSRTAPIFEGGGIVLMPGKVLIYTCVGAYERSVGVRPAEPGVCPVSQGQG